MLGSLARYTRTVLTLVPLGKAVDGAMELAKEVQSFSSACERLLDTIARHRSLDKNERRLIEHYCKEILAKIQPIAND